MATDIDRVSHSVLSEASSLFPWRDLAELCRRDSQLGFLVGSNPHGSTGSRQLLAWEQVLANSDQGRAFADAVALPSYAKFAGLANASAQVDADLNSLAEQPVLRLLSRVLIAQPILVLLPVATFFVSTPIGLIAFGLVVSWAIGPLAGLTWRTGNRTRSTANRRSAAALIILSGLAVTAVLMALAFRHLAGGWLFLGSGISVAGFCLFLGLTITFSLDHTRRPGIRSIKVLLLRLEQGTHGNARAARAARIAWLTDALNEAVLPELTATVNRMLGPDREKTLLVSDAHRLRITYSAESRIATPALRHATDALRRSEGASIAVSGPRGCGKTDLLRHLCDMPSNFGVLISAPTQYAPQEFLIELFQRLCIKYIKANGYEVENDALTAQSRITARLLRCRPVWFLRALVSMALGGLLAWDLTGGVAAGRIDGVPGWVWHQKPLVTAVALAAAMIVVAPKRNLSAWGHRRNEQELVKVARRHLLHLQAEQTATTQLGATLPVMQTAFSRAIARRSLPWTMPELVGHLEDFIARVAEAEIQENQRKLLICVDEVDRIGSVPEAAKFINAIKAIFAVPNCYFFVSIADELGLRPAGAGIGERSPVDNAFDEVISMSPLSFESCRELLIRRVPGFGEAFVWLSFVLSGGLPRDLIRAARKLVGMAEVALGSSGELRVAQAANWLIREEVQEVATAARNSLARMSLPSDWDRVHQRLQAAVTSLQHDSPSHFSPAALADLAGIADLVPAQPSPEASAVVVRIAAIALLGRTTCALFGDGFYDKLELRASVTDSGNPYSVLAGARRELPLSPDSSFATVQKLQISLDLP